MRRWAPAAPEPHRGTGLIVTLRERLRVETRASQDAVDRAFRRFDLAAPDGLRGFLAAQRDGVACLVKAAGPREALAADWSDAVADLEADLSALDHRAPATVPKPPKPDHVLARLYVWHGLRLGARMLSRRWDAAADPTARNAGRYLQRARDREAWRGLIDTLDDHSARGRESDAVTRAANDWLALFEHCAAAHAPLGAPGRPAADGVDADA